MKFLNVLVIVLFFAPIPSMAQSSPQLDQLAKILAIQHARIQALESRQPLIVTKTSRPGSYGQPNIKIKQETGGAAGRTKFADLSMKLNSKRKVFVNATVTIRPVNYQATNLGAAIVATKGELVVVISDKNNPTGSIERGSGDGPYFRPRPDAYTTIPISGVLELPEAGEWKIQILLENSSGTTPILVHTYSLTAIAF